MKRDKKEKKKDFGDLIEEKIKRSLDKLDDILHEDLLRKDESGKKDVIDKIDEVLHKKLKEMFKDDKGEKTGALEKLLMKISEFYDQEVRATVKSLTSLIEPLMIATMGVIVGFIVLAIFMPIMKIQQQLTK